MKTLSTPTSPEDPLRAWGWMVLSGLGFGFMGISVRILNENFSPYFLTFLRSTINFILSVGVAAAIGRLVFPKNSRILIFRGFVGFLGITSYFFALDGMPLSLAAVLVQVSPLFVLIFSKIFLKEPAPSGSLIWGLVAFLGSLVLLIPSAPELIETAEHRAVPLISVAACFFAAACSGMAHTLIRAAAFSFKTHEVLLVFTGLSMVLSSFSLMGPTRLPEGKEWGWIVVMGVFSWLAQWCLTKAFECARAVRVGTMTLQNPVIAALLAMVFLGENLKPIQWLGMGMVLGALARLSPRKVRD